MSGELEGFFLTGVNAGLKLLTKSVPGGEVAFDAGCDAGALAGRMMADVFPKLKGGLTAEEVQAIVDTYKSNVPEGVWNVALAAFRSAFDRVAVGSIHL